MLRRAHVEARNSEHYRITKGELDWLGARIEHLQALVETVCKERLARLDVSATISDSADSDSGAKSPEH